MVPDEGDLSLSEGADDGPRLRGQAGTETAVSPLQPVSDKVTSLQTRVGGIAYSAFATEEKLSGSEGDDTEPDWFSEGEGDTDPDIIPGCTLGDLSAYTGYRFTSGLSLLTPAERAAYAERLRIGAPFLSRVFGDH